MRKLFLLLTIFIFLFSGSKAQYRIGIGARFGKINNGVTYKQIFNADQNLGIEVQMYSTLSAATYGYSIKGFLIKQVPFKIPVIQLPLDFVGGGGLQFAYFPYDAPGYYKVVDGDPVYYGQSVFTAGIAASLGIEYQIKKRGFPFTIGLDMVPSYDFVNPGPDWFDFGVDVRYVYTLTFYLLTLLRFQHLRSTFKDISLDHAEG